MCHLSVEPCHALSEIITFSRPIESNLFQEVQEHIVSASELS